MIFVPNIRQSLIQYEMQLPKEAYEELLLGDYFANNRSKGILNVTYHSDHYIHFQARSIQACNDFVLKLKEYLKVPA